MNNTSNNNIANSTPAKVRVHLPDGLSEIVVRWISPEQAQSFAKRIAFFALILCGLASLMWLSLYLAAMRIYQVDECMETYVAKVLSTGQDKLAAGHVTLFQVLLSWVIPSNGRSVDFLNSSRLVMVVIFWLNWMLLAAATGSKLLSRRWLVACLGAGTLAPLWDYGFEIRHDNLMLTGLLLCWGIVRFGNVAWGSFFLLGTLCTALQFVAFKSFAYTLPLSLAVVIFPRPGQILPRSKMVLAWVLGAVSTFLVLRVILGATGLWELFLGTNRFLSEASGKGHWFGPGIVLKRLLTQTPLLLALLIPALIAIAADFRRRGKAALNWEGNLPEALLFLGALGVLLANPAPFPYNVLHLVPYAFVFVFRYGANLWDQRKSLARPEAISFGLSILLFTHLVPFAIATLRHLDWSNVRQEALMNVAEDLTDPEKDPVYDAIGMVSARPIVNPLAFLHSLNFQSARNSGPQWTNMLAANPAAVIIPTYRTDWLSRQDHAFIQERYVSVADDLMVLGKVLAQGGGSFEIIREGRYRIAALQSSGLSGTCADDLQALLNPVPEIVFEGKIDGKAITSQPVELSIGTHHIECGSDIQPTAVWVGPRQDRLPQLGKGDHRRVFFNWY